MEFPTPELPSWDRARQSHPDLPSTSSLIAGPMATNMLRKSQSHNQHHRRHHHHHIHPYLSHRHHQHHHKEKEKERLSGSNAASGAGGAASEGGRGGGHVRAGSSTAAAAAAVTTRGRRTSLENFQSGATNETTTGSTAVERTPRLSRRWMNYGDGELDMARLREERQLRETALTNNLTTLTDFSHQTIRDLDERYYSFLETLSKLQSSVTSLQNVCSATDEMNVRFEAETDVLESETETHVTEFNNNLDAQQRKITGLGEKLRGGRERVGRLSERMEKLMEMVGEWDRKEKEWQGRVRRRLQLLWIIASLGVILFIVLYFRYQPSTDHHHDHRQSRPISERGHVSQGERKRNRFLGGGRTFDVAEVRSGGGGDDDDVKIDGDERTETKKGNDVLRLFDEL